jgi:hypothetical protein
VHPRLSCLIETPDSEMTAIETAARFGFEEVSIKNWADALGATECDLFVNAGPNKIQEVVDTMLASAEERSIRRVMYRKGIESEMTDKFGS